MLRQPFSLSASAWPAFFRVDCAVTLQRLYCLFVMEAGSRYARILGITASPDRPRATQQVRIC